jgi:hypothetical protein
MNNLKGFGMRKTVIMRKLIKISFDKKEESDFNVFILVRECVCEV